MVRWIAAPGLMLLLASCGGSPGGGSPTPAATPGSRAAPAAFLRSSVGEAGAVLASHCWRPAGSGQAICADTFAFPDPEKVLPVRAGEPLKLRFSRDHAPSALTCERFAEPKDEASKPCAVSASEVTGDWGTGDTWVRITATWPEGRVPYVFKLRVT